MFITNDRGQPDLAEAARPLFESPAPAVRDPNSVPIPTTRFLADHALCKHITQSEKGLVFLPDKDDFNTHAILIAARDAWKQEKLPVLAVCAFSRSPQPFAKATGIQCDTADQFLSDLQFARRIPKTPGEQPSYLIRHVHSPSDVYDDVILPAHANLVVYQPHALSPKQLSTLFEHVANVRGKVILCGDPEQFTELHPQLADHVQESLAKWVSPTLTRDPNRSAVDHSPASSIVRPGGPSLGGDRRRPPPGVSPAGDFFDGPGSYLVYHSRGKNLTQFPNHFKLVAKVEAKSMEQALARTQHSRSPWPDNRGVTAFMNKPRSTQAGDVIVSAGQPHKFDGVRFEPIEAKLEPRTPRPQQSPAPEPSPAPPDLGDESTKPKPTRKLKP
jgi:hypothetical protein